MGINIKIIRCKNFLRVDSQGTLDFEQSKKLLKDIAQRQHAPLDINVLIDFRQNKWLLSTTKIYELAKELTLTEHKFNNKIAVLTLPGTDFDQAEFFKICSQNRGFNIEAFTNFEDAIGWFYGEGGSCAKQE